MDYPNFNIIDLINREEDLFDAIFHNYNGMGDQFKEALISYLITISYSEWTKNIDKYFSLLVALNYMELNLDTVINSIGLYKNYQLKIFSFQVLKTNNEILKIENVNFLQRLLYAPYEIEGTDIYNPPEGSSLVPYNEECEEEKNIFKRIDSINGWIYDSYENRNIFQKLFKDVDFILWYLGSEVSLSEWEEIFKCCNSYYYRIEMSNIFSLQKDKLVEINDLNFFPFIIPQLFNSSANINLILAGEINVNELKFKILRFFIDSIYEGKEFDLSLMLDLYLFLPSSPGVIQYDYQYEVKKMLRNYVIDIFSENKSEKVFDLVLKKVSEQIDKSFDFSPFDIFNNYWEYSDKLKSIIINHYYQILARETLIDHYYYIGGKENIFKAILSLTNIELTTFLNKYDFVTLFNDIDNANNIYNEGIKLRFHLGILTEYSLKYDKHRNEIIDYIINTYKSIIKLKSEIIEPLAWDDIVSDTFLFNTNFSERQLLSIIIIDLLAFKNDDYITDYFNEIKDYLSFTELSFYQKKFPENKSLKHFDPTSLFPKDLKGTGLGRAKVEAQLLLKYDLPDKAIKYVEYIESLGKEYLSNDIKEIKFRACLVLKDFDNAEKTLKLITGEIYNLFGLLSYFKGNFLNSVQYFEQYKKRFKVLTKSDLISYSAALIRNNQHQEAINLLEENIAKYPNEYLIYKNLGAAYAIINKGKALYYLLIAKDLVPYITDIQFAVYESIIEIIPELEKIVNDFSKDSSATNELLTKFRSTAISTIRKTSNYNISDIEELIIKVIFYSIEQKRTINYRLENLSEPEMSDELRLIMQARLIDKGIIVEREAPEGYALKKSGELDFKIYSRDTGVTYAIGENKVWSKENFGFQLKQVLGYAKANRGFCFTIIFNKTEDIKKIVKERENILSTFYVDENDEKYFETVEIIKDASVFIDGIKDVVLTLHKNPEDDSIVHVYHFIIDAFERERKIAAKQARNKKSQA